MPEPSARPQPPVPYDELLGQIVETYSDGALAKDLEGRYFYVNQAGAALFGKSPLDLLGRTDRELLEPAVADRLEAADRTAVEGRPALQVEYEVMVAGAPRLLSCRNTALRGLAGQVRGILSIVRDVTEVRRRGEAQGRTALQSELARLREMDAMKTQFINHTAHELSTPLTPIKLQLHLLRTQATHEWTDQERRSLEILDRNFERLVTLVGDVLDASRLQAGRLGVQRQPLDVGPLVQEAYDSFRPLYEQNKVRLALDRVDGLYVDGDPLRLSQVLFNYLHNAQKFTGPGGEVRLAARRMDGHIEVEVSDNGSGLTPQQIESLFQPFSQVHETQRGSRVGTGLGLFISKGIVELHGGAVSVTSDGPGRGSRFAFRIPARTTLPDRQAKEATSSTQRIVKNEFQRRVHELV